MRCSSSSAGLGYAVGGKGELYGFGHAPRTRVTGSFAFFAAVAVVRPPILC